MGAPRGSLSPQHRLDGGICGDREDVRATHPSPGKLDPSQLSWHGNSSRSLIPTSLFAEQPLESRYCCYKYPWGQGITPAGLLIWLEEHLEGGWHILVSQSSGIGQRRRQRSLGAIPTHLELESASSSTQTKLGKSCQEQGELCGLTGSTSLAG